MRTAVWWQLAACFLLTEATFFRAASLRKSHLFEPADVIKRSYGRWTCSEPSFVDKVLRLEIPGLPLAACAADGAATVVWALVGASRSFLLTGADGGHYRCKFCESRWVPLPKTAQRQCRLRAAGVYPEGRDPTGGALRYRRLDGVSCHRAYTKGCHGGFRWCDGSCCRRDSFFFYPGLQPNQRIYNHFPSEPRKGTGGFVRPVLEAISSSLG